MVVDDRVSREKKQLYQLDVYVAVIIRNVQEEADCWHSDPTGAA